MFSDEKAKLIRDVLGFASHELEESTRTGYDQRLKPLREFCLSLNEPFPPSPWVIAAFVKKRSDERLSFSSIRGVRSAVSDLFRHSGGLSPADDSLVTSTLKAAKKVAPPVKPKDPLTRDLLIEIWSEFDRFAKSKGPNLLPARRASFARDFAMAVMAYRGCLRGDEVVNIRSDEFWFDKIPATPDTIKTRGYPPEIASAEFVFLFINSSKTNPQKQKRLTEREGHTVVIGFDSDPRLDPASVLHNWLKHRDEKASHLFHSENGSNPLTVKAFSETITKRAQLAGLTGDLSLSGHSLRAGGATDAAKVTDINLVRKHGRWKSDAVLLYVRDDAHASIAVNIGLGMHSTSSASAAAAAAAPNPTQSQVLVQRPLLLTAARPSSLASLPPPKRLNK